MAAWEAERVRWEEALEVLRSTEAPRYLSGSQELSRLARVALAGLYASLRPYCPPASAPLDRLLTDEAFDAEQIWQQIDLVARPLLSSLRRHLTRLSTDAPPLRIRTERKEGPAASGAPLLEEMMGAVPHVDEEKEVGGEDSGEAEEEEEEEEEEDEDEDEGGGVEGNAGVVEDRFLKIKELEEYLQRDEAKEYGLSMAQHKNSNKKMAAMDKEEEEDDDDGEDEGEEEDNDDGDEDEQDGGFDVRWPPLSLLLTVMKNVF